jgi:hypothetical protein
MDKREAIKRIKQFVDCGDNELAHSEADKVLCELLKNLGYKEVVDVWEKIDKWYA